MTRETQEPQIDADPTFGGGVVRLRHPAFGQISVSRIQGHSVLYGSDFQHQHSVAVRVHTSTLARHLNTDWPFADKQILEVEMSEAQWAAFVSSFGQGSGVQCTIRHRETGVVPGIPLRDEANEFASEMSDQSRNALDALQAAASAVAQAKIGKKDAEAILAGIRKAAQGIGVNADFVRECFDRHMEERLLKAKVEINAYFEHTAHRRIEALRGGENPSLTGAK